jgi:hypothetical protein
MHLVVLVEEESARAALEILLPRIVGERASYEVIAFAGKDNLLANLRMRLRGYRRWVPSTTRIVVVVDSDRGPCEQVKARLERIAAEAGLPTKARPDRDGGFVVINRLAVEELEAWLFGDPAALCAVYPRVPATLGGKARFRDPDAIHDPFEVLERLLQKAGYHRRGLPKIAVARAVAGRMDPDRNRSRSFRLFRDSLLQLVGEPAP